MADELNAIDDGLVTVILEAHKAGFTAKSNFARDHAEHIGMAASMGLLTTQVYKNVYSREWRPTVKGLAFLREMDLEEQETTDND